MITERGHRLETWWGYEHLFRLGSDEENRRERARKEAWGKAITLLRSVDGVEITAVSLREDWATGLVDFVQRWGRIPDLDEQQSIMDKTLSNNDAAAAFEGDLAPMVRALRAGMHDKTRRVLTEARP